MKKILIIITLFMFLIVPETYATDCFRVVIGATEECGSNAIYVEGIYPIKYGSVGASDARSAGRADSTICADGTGYDGWTIPDQIAGSPCSSDGNWRQFSLYCSPSSANNYKKTYHIYIFPTDESYSTYEQCNILPDSDGDGVPDGEDQCPDTPSGFSVDEDGCPPDGDGDGIPDEQDPYPDNTVEDCIYRLIYQAWDNSSNLKAYMIETNYGDTQWLQDYWDGIETGSSRLYATVGGKSYPYSCNTLGISGDSDYDNLTISDGQSVSLGTDINSNGEAQVTASNLESGDLTEAGDSDSDLLGKIVDNTYNSLQNDQKIADRLLAIEQNTRQSNTSGSNSNVSISNPNVGDSINDALQTQHDQNEETYGTGLSNLNSYNPASQISEAGYTQSDVPEKNLLSSIFDNFISNNPISTLLSQSGANVSSQNPSFNVDLELLGQQGNIEFSFDQYESWLDLLGTIIYGFAGLTSILIIIKR